MFRAFVSRHDGDTGSASAHAGRHYGPALLALVVSAAFLAAGSAAGQSDSAENPTPPVLGQEPRASETPLSAVGLFPVYGTLLDIDRSWVDGKRFPSTRSNFGIAETLQEIVDNQVRPCGFNVISFPVDVRDKKGEESNRLANLILWGKRHNMRLAPILVGARRGEPIPHNYPERAGAFVNTVVSLLKQHEPEGLSPYNQILYYQIEFSLNDPSTHGKIDATAAAAMVTRAAASVRANEASALKDAQMQPSQLMATASFDFALIGNGALAGATVSQEVYEQAFDSFTDFLSAVSVAPEIDVLGAEWYPGSLSAGAGARLPDLVRRLGEAFPAKPSVLMTGFSTGFHTQEEQLGYYRLAFANLADYRAAEGVDAPFAGILWRSMLDGPSADAAPPTADTVAAMAGWDWADKAQELVVAIAAPARGTNEVRWWHDRVMSNFGLLALTKDPSGATEVTPKQAFELLVDAQSVAAKVVTETGAEGTARELVQADASADESQGADTSERSVFGQRLKQNLQDTFFQILTAYVDSVVIPGATGGASSQGGVYGGQGTDQSTDADSIDDGTSGASSVTGPDLAIEEPVQLPQTPTAGMEATFSVLIRNQGTSQAESAIAYLMDADGNSPAHSDPMPVAANTSEAAVINWFPDRAGEFSGLKVEVSCYEDIDMTNNQAPVSTLHVAEAPAGDPDTPPGIPSGLHTSAFGPMTQNLQPGFLSIDPPSIGTGTTHSTSTGQSPSAPRVGQAARISLPVANPHGHPLANVKVSLLIDGKRVASRSLGPMLAGQRRTILFTEWTPTKTGAFAMQVKLQGTGPRGSSLISSVTGMVKVLPPGPSPTPAAGSKPGPAPASKPGGSPPGPGTPGLVTPRRISPVLPRPGRAPAPISPPAGTRPIVPQTVGGKGVILPALTPGDIRLNPYPVKVGQPLHISVRLSNREAQALNGASIEVYVDSQWFGGASVSISAATQKIVQVPGKWNATPGVHTVRARLSLGKHEQETRMVFDVRREAPAPPPQSRTTVTDQPGPPVPVRPRVTVSSHGIHLAPATPRVGDRVTMTVNVTARRTSRGDVARVQLFVDGVQLGETTINLAQGGIALARGFPQWNATLGEHTIRVVATLENYRAEATRSIAVAVRPMVAPTPVVRP